MDFLLSDEEICEACPAIGMRTTEHEHLRCHPTACLVHPDNKLQAKFQAKKLINWLFEPCTEHPGINGWLEPHRYKCPECMKQLEDMK